MEKLMGYKVTELGVIPEDWEFKALNDLFTLKNGYSFSSDYFSNIDSNSPILLTPGNFKLDGGLYFIERNTKYYTGEYPGNFVLNKGELVVVMTDLTPDCNLLGKPAFVDVNKEILHNQRIGRILHNKSAIELSFLYYSLLSDAYLKKIKDQATGSTVRHTSTKSIYSVFIPVPPLPEQKAIAAALSDVDALITAQEALIAKKRDIKTATMQQLLTGKVRLGAFGQRVGASGGQAEAGVPPGYQQTELGVIPADWEVVKLKQACHMKSGDSITSSFINEHSTYPCYGGNGLRGYTSKYTHDGSFVLIGRQGALCGNIQFVSGKIFASEHAIVVTALSSTDITWLAYILEDMKLNQYSESSAQPGLSVNKLLEMVTALPPLSEQKAIAEVLSDMDAEITALEAQRDKTRALKQGMMQELLTGKTRLVGSAS